MLGFLKKHDHRFLILLIGWFVSSVGFALAIPFISIYFHSELKMSLSQIGIFFGVAGVVRAISQSFGGELSDKLGRYRIMVIAQICRSAAFLLIAYSIHAKWSFYGIGGVILINFIFGSLFQPAANASVADLVRPKDRTEGYATVRVADNLGWAVGPALGGYIAANSYSDLFIFSAILTFVSGAIIGLFVKGIKSPVLEEKYSGWKDIFSIKDDKIILRHVAFIFILQLCVAQMIAPFSLYSVDFIGITKSQLGFLFMLNGLMVTFLQIPITRMLRQTRLTSQLAMGAMFYILGFIIIGFSSSYGYFIIAFVILTMGENFVSPPGMSIAANLAPEGKIGRYMGIYGFAIAAGWSFGPLVGGLLLDLAKPNFIFMWGFIALLTATAALGFRKLSRYIPPELNIYRK